MNKVGSRCTWERFVSTRSGRVEGRTHVRFDVSRLANEDTMSLNRRVTAGMPEHGHWHKRHEIG